MSKMSKSNRKEIEITSEKVSRLAERTEKVLDKVTKLDDLLEEYTKEN
jgi:hypothetical protein